MPRHTRRVQDRKRIANIIGHLFEVHDASIVVVLTGEKRSRKVSWVNVRERMGMGIPASKAKIEAANGSKMIVHHHNLKHDEREVSIIPCMVTFS